MFEKQLALEKAQGYRGLATRFVGPILDAHEAELVIRETCFILLGISAVFILISVGHGVLNLLFPAVVGLPAGITALTRARAAAVILVVGTVLFGALYTLVRPAGPWGVVFAVVMVLIAVRASEAAFKRKRLLPRIEAPPVGFTPPGPPAV